MCVHYGYSLPSPTEVNCDGDKLSMVTEQPKRPHPVLSASAGSAVTDARYKGAQRHVRSVVWEVGLFMAAALGKRMKCSYILAFSSRKHSYDVIGIVLCTTHIVERDRFFVQARLDWRI